MKLACNHRYSLEVADLYRFIIQTLKVLVKFHHSEVNFLISNYFWKTFNSVIRQVSLNICVNIPNVKLGTVLYTQKRQKDSKQR